MKTNNQLFLSLLRYMRAIAQTDRSRRWWDTKIQNESNTGNNKD